MEWNGAGQIFLFFFSKRKQTERWRGRTGNGGMEEYKAIKQQQAAAGLNRRVPPSTIKAPHQPGGHLR